MGSRCHRRQRRWGRDFFMSSRWGMTSSISGGPMEQVSNERYQEKAALRQASYARKKASATEEKGLIIVHTGPGKGKTTAALGLAFRALGQGMKVGIVQFIKGAIPTGEANLVTRLQLPIEMHTMGDGFTWKTQDRERDVTIARKAWDKAVDRSRDEYYG